MGDGSDFLDSEQPQNGGEYFGGTPMAPAPGPWGPSDQGYDPRYVNTQPTPVYPPQQAPAYPQHQQPPAEYLGPPANMSPLPQTMYSQPRRRKATKGMVRMYLAQYYEALLEMPLFRDPSDSYANTVQSEVTAFAQRRIDELLGEVPEKGLGEGFTAQEAQVLRALAQKMLEPEVEVSQEPAQISQPVQTPAPQPVASSTPLPQPVVAAPASVPRPVQSPRPPAPQLQEPTPTPMLSQAGPRVIARPTPAQRQELERARSVPPRNVAPVRQAPAQMVQYPMTPMQVPTQPVAQPRRRRGRPTAQSVPSPVAPGPPPPLRYAMPTGAGMTAVSAMKAEQQIAAGEPVLSQTFVRSAKQ